jgi:hypothetical protein
MLMVCAPLEVAIGWAAELLTQFPSHLVGCHARDWSVAKPASLRGALLLAACAN